MFGHVPNLPDCFHKLNRLLRENGELHAFSESITGERLFIANYLRKRGVNLDDSGESIPLIVSFQAGHCTNW
ncbi:MAG: hypothetical protein HY273_03200 [Gammaproteobacteria bacterium]|nr:hypothetical protein [Gammaproteobacteria bacterium]